MFDPDVAVKDSSLTRLEEREDLGPFVYFIRQGRFVKIGTSVNPSRRFDQLCRAADRTHRPIIVEGSPELTACVPGSSFHERQLHRKYKGQRDAGEWFELNDALREEVAAACIKQIEMEIRLSGAEPGSHEAGAIFLRRLRYLDAITDEEFAAEIDDEEL